MKKIIISNGFTNFPLRFVAEGLHKKGHDVDLLTGIYPYKKLINLFKILHIDKFGPIQRIINRKISIPDKKIQSFFISEIFYQIGRNLYNHFEGLKKIYKYIDFNTARSYQLSSNKFLKNLPLNKKYIYLCRAGYGGNLRAWQGCGACGRSSGTRFGATSCTTTPEATRHPRTLA